MGVDYNSVLSAVPGISGFLAGLFGNRDQTTTSKSTTSPTLNPLATQGYDDIIKKYQSLLTTDPDLTGYQAGQSNQINKLADIAKQNSVESMAARGINSGPAVNTAINTAENNRIGQQVDLSNSIPLLSRGLTENTLTGYLNATKSIPSGTSSESSYTIPGDMLTGILSAIASSGTPGSGKDGGNIWGDLVKVLGPIFGGLFGGKTTKTGSEEEDKKIFELNGGSGFPV